MDGWMDGWMDGCAMQDKNEKKLCGKILQNDYFDSHSNQIASDLFRYFFRKCN